MQDSKLNCIKLLWPCEVVEQFLKVKHLLSLTIRISGFILLRVDQFCTPLVKHLQCTITNTGSNRYMHAHIQPDTNWQAHKTLHYCQNEIIYHSQQAHEPTELIKHTSRASVFSQQ